MVTPLDKCLSVESAIRPILGLYYPRPERQGNKDAHIFLLFNIMYNAVVLGRFSSGIYEVYPRICFVPSHPSLTKNNFAVYRKESLYLKIKANIAER